jgi:hypothetical protein
MTGDVHFFVARQERTKDQQLTTRRSCRKGAGSTENHMSECPGDMANVLPRERIMGNFVGRLTINGGEQHQSKKVVIVIHALWDILGIILGRRIVAVIGFIGADVG